jgi:hypothetical protein
VVMGAPEVAAAVLAAAVTLAGQVVTVVRLFGFITDVLF